MTNRGPLQSSIVMPIDQMPSLRNGGFVVGADQWGVSNDVPFSIQSVSAVLLHWFPLGNRALGQNSW
jgi:hypothetical protein